MRDNRCQLTYLCLFKDDFRSYKSQNIYICVYIIFIQLCMHPFWNSSWLSQFAGMCPKIEDLSSKEIRVEKVLTLRVLEGTESLSDKVLHDA